MAGADPVPATGQLTIAQVTDWYGGYFWLRTPLQYAGFALLAFACWRRGGWPEKLSSLILLNMLVLDQLHHLLIVPYIELNHHLYRPGHGLIDLFTFLCLAAVALHANRVYPMVLAGLHLISVMSYLTYDLPLRITFIPAYLASVAPSYFELLTLFIGLIAHIRREKKYGSYPDWTRFEEQS